MLRTAAGPGKDPNSCGVMGSAGGDLTEVVVILGLRKHRHWELHQLTFSALTNTSHPPKLRGFKPALLVRFYCSDKTAGPKVM